MTTPNIDPAACSGSRRVLTFRASSPLARPACPQCGQVFLLNDTAGGKTYAIIPDHSAKGKK